MKLIQNYLTNNDCYKSGRTITPIGIQIHSIGTGQNTATSLMSYWNQPGISCCVHYLCDAETEGLAYQILPEERRSWADAGFGNNSLITIEQMESDYIKYTGGSSYTVTNEAKFKADVMRAYNTCVELCASICKRKGWNPWTKLSNGLYLISSHNEGRLAGVSSSHVDPDHIWSRFGLSMDGFRNAVAAKLGTSSSTSTELYRIRKAWKDEASQIGAYESLENAKKNCPSGYSVYNSAGKMVYTVKAKGTQASDLSGLSEKAAIKKVAPLYQTVQKSTGMLASVGLAQFCLESAYGSSELAQQANNLHGMKCELSGNTWAGSTWDGKSRYTKKTTEQDSKGNATQVTADFRKYECLEDSIADRAAYFIGAKNGSKLRYPGIAKITDAKKQIELIKSGGYATDVNYVDKLYSLVTKWDLTQYDIIIPSFEAGKKYKLLVDNYIREMPSGGYVGYDELSSGVKKKVVRQGNKVKLKANNVVEAKEIQTTDDGNIWIRIKSGWLAAYVSGTVRLAEYVKDSSSANTDEEEVTFQPYSVQITSADVNIRAGAGTNYASKGFTGKGTFTIVDEATDTSGRKWGLLKAYESKRNGWIALWLDCVKKG